MGRENGEDYNTDFTVMLNTWEGAVKFLSNSKGSPKPEHKVSKPLDVAQNGEDYSADFVLMMNTWDGAVKFTSPVGERAKQPVEIARLLGWMEPDAARKSGCGLARCESSSRRP